MVQDEIQCRNIELVWSYILDIENDMNPHEMRQNQIREWKKYAVTHVLESQTIISNAEEIVSKNLRSKDALHLSCAISASCDFFLTTDDKILNKDALISGIRIIDPTNFIREILSP